MDLWLISRPDSDDYPEHDTYDSAVVAAPTKKAAAHIHPRDGVDWDGKADTSWIAADDVIVEYLGIATLDAEAGVICASFNAG